MDVIRLAVEFAQTSTPPAASRLCDLLEAVQHLRVYALAPIVGTVVNWRITYKLYPTAAQARALWQHHQLHCDLHNAAVRSGVTPIVSPERASDSPRSVRA